MRVRRLVCCVCNWSLLNSSKTLNVDLLRKMKKWRHRGSQFAYTCASFISNKNIVTTYVRKNFQRQLDALQQSVDEETKAKNEQTRQRKLIEGQISDLEGAVEAKEKQAADQAKNLKKLQAQLKVIIAAMSCSFHYNLLSL